MYVIINYDMKVYQPAENLNSLKTLILQLQLSLEISQFQELLITYTDLIFLFAEYPYLFNFFKNEPIPLKGKNKLFKNNFITQDPARDGGNWYGYARQNPVRFIDILGLAAGDFFETPDDAAKDWAYTYADDSIAENSEFGSTIYSMKTKEGTKYSYNLPKKGSRKNVDINQELENGQKAVSSIHSHGSYDPDYDDDNPSELDKENCVGEKDYVVTPFGKLKSYTKDGKEEVITNDLKRDAWIDYESNPDISTKSNYKYIKDERL